MPMQNSNQNKIWVLLISLFLNFGCSTSSLFKVNRHRQSSYELKVSPDRLTFDCERVNTDDGEVGYGFSILILDDKKTVLGVNQGNLLDKESCFRRSNLLRSKIAKAQFVYIVGVGNLNKEPMKFERLIEFEKHGRFKQNGQGLQFLSLTTDYGYCFDAHGEDDPPCPYNPFPKN